MQNSKPVISAVISLYNKAATITRAIDSVFSQRRPPQALIVVDDGSSDESAAVCRAALSRAPAGIECVMISQSNAGVSAARNRGADALRSDYIAFLDADDEWSPDHLAEIEKLACAFPNAGLLSTRYARLNARGSAVPEPSPLAPDFFGIVQNALDVYRRGYGVLHTSFVAVARNAWFRSGGFPVGARKSQDMHLWLRLLLNEPFAHSGVSGGVWHDEDTGVSRRKGAVPCHFPYFLKSEEGRQFLSNPELLAFLASNLAIHIGGHRLLQDPTVVTELRQLSGALPMRLRARSWVVSAMPLFCLQALASRRRRARAAAR